jgi:hypothetical protein
MPGHFVSQHDRRFAERGLTVGGVSNLCGLTCGSRLLESARIAFNIKARHFSNLDEITYLTHKGNHLGENIPVNGIGAPNLKKLIQEELASYGMFPRATALSIAANGQGHDFHSVPGFSIDDIRPNPNAASAVIILVSKSENGLGHFININDINPRTRHVLFENPDLDGAIEEGWLEPYLVHGKQTWLLKTATGSITDSWILSVIRFDQP